MNATQSTPRLVMAGHMRPGRTALTIAPDFGSADEWAAVMSDAAEATPEELEMTLDYESWLEDVEWVRHGC